MASDEALIEAVRRHPLLYDLSLEDYKNLKKKDYAWRDVAAKIKLNEVQCKKRWKGLRDCYKRCKRQQTLTAESGSSPKRKWRHMHALSFLDKVESSRNAVENIPKEEELFEECITPNLFNVSTQFDQIGSESTKCSSESPLVRKQNDHAKFEKFLELASESITKSCHAFVEKKPENSTTLLFKSLAAKIVESNMPLTESNKLAAKVSALVFSEIEKYMDTLEWL